MRTLRLAVLLLLLVTGCRSSGQSSSARVDQTPKMPPGAEDPQSAQDYVAQGDYYLAQRGKEIRAIASFTKAIKLEDTGRTASSAHCGIGEAYRHTRRYKEAVESYRSAVKADQTNPRAWTYLGVVYYDETLAEGRVNEEKLNKTIEYTTKAIAADPLYAEGYMWRGRARQFLGFKREAADDYAAALDLGLERTPELLVTEQYANTLSDSGQYDLAIQEWRKLQAAPESTGAQKRRWEELIKVAERAKQLRDQAF